MKQVQILTLFLIIGVLGSLSSCNKIVKSDPEYDFFDHYINDSNDTLYIKMYNINGNLSEGVYTALVLSPFDTIDMVEDKILYADSMYLKQGNVELKYHSSGPAYSSFYSKKDFTITGRSTIDRYYHINSESIDSLSSKLSKYGLLEFYKK